MWLHPYLDRAHPEIAILVLRELISTNIGAGIANQGPGSAAGVIKAKGADQNVSEGLNPGSDTRIE